MNIKKKQFNFLRFKTTPTFSNFMDTIFMRLCIIHLGLQWFVNIWIPGAILSIYLEKESNSKYFGRKKNLKK